MSVSNDKTPTNGQKSQQESDETPGRLLEAQSAQLGVNTPDAAAAAAQSAIATADANRDVQFSAGHDDGRTARGTKLRTERKARILASARRVFADRGYHATSVADILAASRSARGTFYLHFDSKKAIFEALLDDFFARLAAVVTPVDVEPGARPPIEQVRENVDRVLAVLDGNRDLTKILLRGAMGLDSDFDRKLNEFYGKILFLIRRALQTGQGLGLIRKSDAEVTALCVLGSVKEVFAEMLGDERFSGESSQSGNAEEDARRIQKLDRIAREIITYNLLGLWAAR